MDSLLPDDVESARKFEERTRKNEQIILQLLASVGQRDVATKLGVSESTISRMKSDGELRRAAMILAACGLKAVPESMRCAKPELFHAAWVFAQEFFHKNDSDAAFYE